MAKEKVQKDSDDQAYSPNYEGEMEFDWKDIAAFIIAIFQVLFPYVLFIFGGIGLLMLIFYYIIV
ncbi:hypothetical protein [Alkaliphilus crotonatoxidans]